MSTAHGTINSLARDRDGNLATAVSTSGWAWGYPGRLGDSPVLGARSYADNRWAAAASTGTGEAVLRVSTTRSIVLYMKMGWDLGRAVREAMNRDGEHVGFSYREDERYVYMTDTMSDPAEVNMVSP